jgi:NitT/TauT family transport system substrate-binding protein
MRAPSLTRRSFLFAIGALAACRRSAGEPGLLRVGYLPNLTHAPVIVGVRSGRVADVTGLAIESRVMRAGPRVVEALIGGAIDIGITGPAPVLFAHARHGPGTLLVLAGVASGGASLVAASGVDLSSLSKKTFATPQIGSTQDVALRRYIASRGFKTTHDVRVTALAPAVILGEMRRGGVDAAWLPEPWASRAESEGAARVLDERDLWPDRRFASAVIVARPGFVSARENDVRALLFAMEAEVIRARDTRAEAYDAIDALTRGGAGSRSVFDQAFARVDFVSDPMRSAIEKLASDARAVGVLPDKTNLKGLFRAQE